MSRVRPPDSKSLLLSITGFIALSVLLTTVVVTSFLDVNNGSDRRYVALLEDASGLRSGDNVTIAGLDIGKVTAVDLADDSNAVRVTFTVKKGNDVYKNTSTAVRYANLIGSRYLALVPPTNGSAGPALAVGSTIPAARNIAAIDLTAVFDGFQPLFDALDPNEINELTGSIINIFQGQSGTVANLVDQVGRITTHLAGRKQTIHTVITSLAGLLTSVNRQATALDQMIGDFNSVVTNVAGQRTILAQTITGLATFTHDASALTKQATPAINKDIEGVAVASAVLAKNQDQINGLIADSPKAIAAFNKIADSGSFFKVYLCNLNLKVTGALNLSLVPGLPAPQPPKGLTLPSGAVGDPSRNGALCR